MVQLKKVMFVDFCCKPTQSNDRLPFCHAQQPRDFRNPMSNPDLVQYGSVYTDGFVISWRVWTCLLPFAIFLLYLLDPKHANCID